MTGGFGVLWGGGLGVLVLIFQFLPGRPKKTYYQKSKPSVVLLKFFFYFWHYLKVFSFLFSRLLTQIQANPYIENP